jgi:hypothetical protein
MKTHARVVHQQRLHGFSAQANVSAANANVKHHGCGRSQKTAWMLRSLLEK